MIGKATLLMAVLLSLAFGQWQPDRRLTNDGANSITSPNNAWCVAAAGDNVHVVWTDHRDGSEQIYYKRSTDGGANWPSSDTRLTNNAATSNIPSVAAAGDAVHVVWYDDRNGTSNLEIYYKRSTDGGASWPGGDTRLTNAAGFSVNPSVAAAGAVVHVVWRDDRDGNNEIYYKRSTDGGTTWGGDFRFTNDTAASQYPSVAVAGDTVHVVWDDRRAGNYEIYHKRSTDGGATWGSDNRLTNDAATSSYSSVAAAGDAVHVVWSDLRDGHWEVYYKHSTDGGTTWSADLRLTNDAAASTYPSVAAAGPVVHVVWWDGRDGNEEIYDKRSTDGGAAWGSDTRLTNDLASSRWSSVAVAGPAVHVVWSDTRDGNYEIYYKCNPTGNQVAVAEPAPDCPLGFLRVAPNPVTTGFATLRFSLPNAGNISLKLYDVTGKLIATLSEGYAGIGTRNRELRTENLSRGVYVLRLETEGATTTQKLILE
jgi:hypothetical protein